ncbi:SCP2 sterol-binding domain-containing protein [Alishewanella sp. 16-MA]|uniref:Ubiquinone biosynthesis accessory factor UbiJ n=1 Tax=Alishewanella maricola TaxID=2795740 RepID=A0ABS8C4M0_9ALTE|nr:MULTISPECIES: SCP2 sterol-binding domain-containing protein [Alishewanella]MDP4945638.1 SCP2 sterol-binding domain-containing protein [Alishewanella sp.]MDP5206049.1 SCP2 sterol-binding domain-containing protein [Alishewanella sp. SMS9]MCB5227288.1 SCP2 sterol-binding domain-containing protein [Alishewanella maricola]MDP5034997.1 SCP2 sterol-binding domain-containing protein [Alishewanella sp.]MDP5186899.1 SCP2 sterol-binding domain-containing protein [Alishewanella sp.]
MLPLLPQLLCAIAEKLSRKLIAMDPACKPALQRLQGKQLSFCLRDLNLTLVVSASHDSLLINMHNEATDCKISTNLATLRQLRDPSQLTKLIKSDALDIDGDLQVAQQFSYFLQQLNPDWQHALSGYIGDAAAHKISITLSQLQAYLQEKVKLLSQLQLELVQDELRLSPTRLEADQFTQELSELQARLEMLRRQLKQYQEL